MPSYASFAFSYGPAATRAERLDRLDRLARMLDAAFLIPGTGIRVGADAVVGVVPVLGNLVTTGLSAWIIWEARQMGASSGTLLRMAANVALDAAMGAVPAVGNVADVFFRANLRNIALLRRHLANP